jgi:Trk K+ transport system NAD-binding subunit
VLAGLGRDAAVGGHDEHGVADLAGARDHVLDDVVVARTVDDGEEVLVGVEARRKTTVPGAVARLRRPVERAATSKTNVHVACTETDTSVPRC